MKKKNNDQQATLSALPQDVLNCIGSFIIAVPKGQLMFYDEGYGDGHGDAPKKESMMSFPCIPATPYTYEQNTYLLYAMYSADIDTLPLVDMDPDPWYKWFELILAKTFDNTIVASNNCGEYVRIGTLNKRTFTLCMKISRSLTLRNTFVSNCDLFGRVCIEEPNENITTAIMMQIQEK